MKFCPKCKSMVFPKNGKLKCRCGWEEKINEEEIEAEYKFEGKDWRTNEANVNVITDNPNAEVEIEKIGKTLT